jgi:hypothetical protein
MRARARTPPPHTHTENTPPTYQYPDQLKLHVHVQPAAPEPVEALLVIIHKHSEIRVEGLADLRGGPGARLGPLAVGCGWSFLVWFITPTHSSPSPPLHQ